MKSASRNGLSFPLAHAKNDQVLITFYPNRVLTSNKNVFEWGVDVHE